MENQAAAGKGDGAVGVGPEEFLLVMGGDSCWVAGQGQGVLWSPAAGCYDGKTCPHVEPWCWASLAEKETSPRHQPTSPHAITFPVVPILLLGQSTPRAPHPPTQPPHRPRSAPELVTWCCAEPWLSLPTAWPQGQACPAPPAPLSLRCKAGGGSGHWEGADRGRKEQAFPAVGKAR